jgi:hypothetical protein
MGLATIVSIQIGMMHLSPNISQLLCPYLTSSVGYLKMCILIFNKILHFCALHFHAVQKEIRKYMENKYQSTNKVTHGQTQGVQVMVVGCALHNSWACNMNQKTP